MCIAQKELTGSVEGGTGAELLCIFHTEINKDLPLSCSAAIAFRKL